MNIFVQVHLQCEFNCCYLNSIKDWANGHSISYNTMVHQLLDLSTDISAADIRMFTENMTGKNEIHFFMQSNLLPCAITCQKSWSAVC